MSFGGQGQGGAVRGGTGLEIGWWVYSQMWGARARRKGRVSVGGCGWGVNPSWGQSSRTAVAPVQRVSARLISAMLPYPAIPCFGCLGKKKGCDTLACNLRCKILCTRGYLSGTFRMAHEIKEKCMLHPLSRKDVLQYEGHLKLGL